MSHCSPSLSSLELLLEAESPGGLSADAGLAGSSSSSSDSSSSEELPLLPPATLMVTSTSSGVVRRGWREGGREKGQRGHESAQAPRVKPDKRKP